MALNLAELQQKADRVIHNADEFVRKWMEFIAAPAGTVTLEYYDRNGNLKTVSFSNRNKLVQDFIANVNSVMVKEVYVDGINGNDGNDGSANSPFATIKKAVESTPYGAFVIVNFLTGGVYDITQNIDVGTRKVIFRNIDQTTPVTIRGVAYEVTSGTTTYAKQYGFYLKNGGSLTFRYVSWLNDYPITLETASYAGTGVLYPSPLVKVTPWEAGLKGIVNFVSTDIQLNSFPVIGSEAYWPASVEVNVHGGNITKNSTAPFVELLGDLILTLMATYNITLQDSAGNTLTWADLITGILYDATATTVPINVISNIDL